MSNLIPGNHKYLTLKNRLYIKMALTRGDSFKDIARFICKNPTTISQEVKKHRLSDWYHKGAFYNAHNFCLHRYRCRKSNVCHKTQITDRTLFSTRTDVDFGLLGSDTRARCVDMDTVHSSRDSKKVLLTFLRKEKRFLAYLMNRCTAVAVDLWRERFNH